MEKTPLQAIVLVTSLGIQFAASLAIGFFLGNYIDKQLETGQTFMIIGLILGIVVGIVGAVRMIKPFLEADN